MGEATWRYRLNSAVFGLLTLGGVQLTAGFWPGNPGWTVAAAGATVLYAAVAALLWRRVGYAAPLGLGLAGFSLGLWVQSLFALGGSPAVASATSVQTCLLGLGISVFAVLALCTIPRTVSWRHGASIAFAGAALVPAVVFALAPAQSLSVSVAMGVGSAAVLTGAVLVGRGRTLGLLLNLVGAIVMAVGVLFAPWLGVLEVAHPMLPNACGFLIDVLGISAASCAAISTAIYLGPLLRFVFRPSPAA